MKIPGKILACFKGWKKCITPKTVILFLCLLLILPWFYNPLVVTSYSLSFASLPSNFDGFKIAVIADLHNHRFGKNQEELIDKILEQEPDIVILAGDVLDKHSRDMTNVKNFLEGISEEFTIIAIPGNHDYLRPSVFDDLYDLYCENEVIFLDGETELIEKEGEFIVFSSAELKPQKKGSLYSIEKSPEPEYKNEFNILLHHFGNEFDIISDEYKLVISGHVHGGIVRLFGKGLINASKRQPLFPKYSKGVYRKESGSVMVLSAGLGDALIPRFNNPREIVMITLKAGDAE